MLKLTGERLLFDSTQHPELDGNINGPSVIRVPPWVKNPLGRYYLYFAHHEGRYIRLAYANELSGPWTIYPDGALHLADSGFCQTAPAAEQTHPDVLRMIAEGVDGDYPHIASPDVHVDPQNKTIKMYFHGRLDDGQQQTRLAVSIDGINFSVNSELLGLSYFRVFELQGYHYAVALGGVLYRSPDGITQFEKGPALTHENYRHGAILLLHGTCYVIWTRAEDCPERLLISRVDCSNNWQDWRLQSTEELHRPGKDWEGSNEPLIASRYGGVMSRVHQLRDPCVFHDEGQIYILYSVAGEQGLALGKLAGAA